MTLPFFSPHRKARQEARNWLEVADRVDKFRRDQLTAAQLEQLRGATAALQAKLASGADAAGLKPAVTALETVLRATGGRHYPMTTMVENVEFFVVAAIVILGLRAYFLQPFKIPTNSMWPSYYGMTYELHPPGDEPSLAARAFRLLTLGATSYSVTAPADGAVMFPVVANGSLMPAVGESQGRSLIVFPTTFHHFTFRVGDELVSLKLPAEFDAGGDWLRDTFFPGQTENALYRLIPRRLRELARTAQPEATYLPVQAGDHVANVPVYWVPLGRRVHRGERFISFDILTGDLLFVDRLSYNFVRPRVGSGFVFKTENIDSPAMKRNGEQIREYYIKRLVGQPGDVLEVRPPELWRNGRPIEGAAAFGRNARREGLYPGYINTGLLEAGAHVDVIPHHFFAMGDNSPNSSDSRAWGFVPEKDVVGRPLFIYYPFTSRWGPAH